MVTSTAAMSPPQRLPPALPRIMPVVPLADLEHLARADRAAREVRVVVAQHRLRVEPEHPGQHAEVSARRSRRRRGRSRPPRDSMTYGRIRVRSARSSTDIPRCSRARVNSAPMIRPGALTAGGGYRCTSKPSPRARRPRSVQHFLVGCASLTVAAATSAPCRSAWIGSESGRPDR